MDKNIISVGQLNTYVKNLLNSDTGLAGVYIKGELSNTKQHSSGHLYFSLKDDEAAVGAVMFKWAASKLQFKPEDGMKVLIRGRVDIFVKNGQYQLYAEEMILEGAGALAAAFDQLKEKLYKEGLFDASHKKPLPKYPAKIGIVTSPTGAAVRDMLRILGRRYPLSKILVCPVLVQGEKAAGEIASAIALLNKTRAVELIITGRGGGSVEDLWAFNEEIVARAIYASAIPVISAVGHEPDVTISDFVADARASTPSNAAEIAVPDSMQLRVRLSDMNTRMTRGLSSQLSNMRARLCISSDKPAMKSPLAYYGVKRQTLDFIASRMNGAVKVKLAASRARFSADAATLDAISPLKVLGRGYSIVRGARGRVLKSAQGLSKGDKINIRLSRGEIDCEILNIRDE